MPVERFEDVFDAVQAGRVTHGILPIENSVGGSIHRNYDLLLEHELPIVGETELTVVHNLLALPERRSSEIRRVFSHPQAPRPDRALHQAASWRRDRRDLRHGRQRTADSRRRPHGYGRHRFRPRRRSVWSRVLEAGIQDFEDNITRFILIAREPHTLGRAGQNRRWPSRCYNAPGALFKALSVFALRDIDLTKLESRPARGVPWEYLFYADLSIGRDDLRCARAIVHLAESARWVKTLGSYPGWRGNAAGKPPSA